MEGHEFAPLTGLLQTRNWDRAWAEFLTIQGSGPSGAELLLLGSQAAFGRRDLFRARQLAEEAWNGLSPADPSKLSGRIRYHLGMVARELGDIHVAHEQLTIFLQDLSAKYPELAMAEGKAHFHLALTLRQRRDLEGALQSYHRAINCFRRDGLPTLLCVGLQNLAWLLCHMQRPGEAESYLDEARTLLTSAEDRIHQTLGEAHLAAVQGNYPAAVEQCATLFRMVERGEPVTAEEQSQAAWVAATVALAQGNPASAAALADIALTFATQAQDARLMNDASSVRREAHMRIRPGA